MGELSILTIVVSLAVCSILAVALYQYVNQRLSLAEHSQKEQAMILHQYIEESSYDIYCLKQQLSHAHKMGLGVSLGQGQGQGQAVYYQQYAPESDEVQHKCVHIDTVMYEAVMNNNNPGKQSGSPRMNLNPNHRLIPVSSDSENTTTDDDDDSGSESDSDSGSGSGSGSDSGSVYENDSIKIIELSQDVTVSKKNDTKMQETASESDSCDSESESSDCDSESDSDSCDSDSERGETVNIIDTVQCNPAIAIDPAIVIESDIPLTLDSTSFDLAIESINIEQISDIVDVMNTLPISEIDETVPETVAADIVSVEIVPEQASSDVTGSKQPAAAAAAAATQSQFAGMSVGDLRQFIKDKCKQQPEKMAEIGDIQKMKKAALVQLAEQLH
jgi:hypothetical protein